MHISKILLSLMKFYFLSLVSSSNIKKTSKYFYGNDIHYAKRNINFLSPIFYSVDYYGNIIYANHLRRNFTGHNTTLYNYDACYNFLNTNNNFNRYTNVNNSIDDGSIDKSPIRPIDEKKYINEAEYKSSVYIDQTHPNIPITLYSGTTCYNSKNTTNDFAKQHSYLNNSCSLNMASLEEETDKNSQYNVPSADTLLVEENNINIRMYDTSNYLFNSEDYFLFRDFCPNFQIYPRY